MKLFCFLPAALACLTQLPAQTTSSPAAHAAEQAPGQTSSKGAAQPHALPGPRPVYPIQAELSAALNSNSLHVGDHLSAKLREEWKGNNDCTLPRASMLHGEVTNLEQAGNRTRVALLFHYTCLHADPQKLIWLALLAPEQQAIVDTHGHPVVTQSIRSSSFGGGGGLGPSGIESHVDMAGRQNPTLPLFVDPEADRRGSKLLAVQAGQVWRLPKLKLEVGIGPNDSSIVSGPGKELKLPNGSIFVLMPEGDAVVPSPSTTLEKHKPIVAAPPKLPPVPEIAACHAPSCNPAAFAGPDTSAAAPIQQISLQKLGYKRLKSAEMQDLEFGAAVTFMDPEHLLFTFDPRRLVSREDEDRPELHPRGIRAALFNIRTGHVDKTLDWRIPDSAQYLWKLDDGGILVHDGNRLRWFGPNLSQERSFTLPGPLHFVRLSPDRKHIAIGTVHELHSKEEHAELARAEHGGPEEEVRVQILNGDLKPGMEGVQSSRFMPPTLMNGGRIDLHHARTDRWYLRETTWTTNAKRDFAAMTSSCLPQLQSLSVNLLYVEGCDAAGGRHWYQVLREDGAPVLRGTIGPREFSPLVSDDISGATFALAIPEGSGDYMRGALLHGADITRERVRVYNAGNGRELLSTLIAFPLPASQPLALSASADRLAVIDGDRILLYTIPQPASPPAAQVAQH